MTTSSEEETPPDDSSFGTQKCVDDRETIEPAPGLARQSLNPTGPSRPRSTPDANLSRIEAPRRRRARTPPQQHRRPCASATETAIRELINKCFYATGSIFSIPPMYGRRTSGTVMEPSAFW